jgi:DNA-binding transcriptional ArsR family regulator
VAATGANGFRALADPTRRRILDLLRDSGPLRVGEIAHRFPRISRPAVSKHLRLLRDARLVREERLGRERWCHLDPRPLAEVRRWLEGYEEFWRGRLAELRRLAEISPGGRAES